MQRDNKCWFKYVDCTDPSVTGRLGLREWAEK